MSDKEIQYLIELAEERIANPVSKKEALANFVRVGILNPDGSFTEPYRQFPQALALAIKLEQH